ncbi:MAG: EVE domain-containing protein [Gammaproteobacteria bacterium]|nr:EVE domain-containing protein [Gammaproteobacteria bacterium]
MNYWLFKSEPDAFSIDDLKQSKTTHWDGVRNYQARNMMRDDMKIGDLAFFYHSNTDVPGIVGVMKIVKEAYPDHTAFDPRDKHYDPKSDPDSPRWFMVNLRYLRKFRKVIPLGLLREFANDELANMPLLRKGNRLSVMPVTEKQWSFILTLCD